MTCHPFYQFIVPFTNVESRHDQFLLLLVPQQFLHQPDSAEVNKTKLTGKKLRFESSMVYKTTKDAPNICRFVSVQSHTTNDPASASCQDFFPLILQTNKVK